MDPEETGESADARCPVCGMRLVPKPQGSGGTQPASERESVVQPAPPGLVPVDLTEDRVQLIGMRTATVVRGMLASELRVVGYIAPTEGSLSSVQTLFSGWIQELHARETGQPVKRGELLARIYSPDLLAAQQELLNAKQWAPTGGAHHEAAQTSQQTSHGGLLEDARRRLVAMGMHAAEVEEVEKSGVPHRLIEVRAPSRGYIVDKLAVEGLYVQPGTQLFRIADLSKVWVLIDIFERDVGRVHVGQPARLALTAYPGETFEGKVDLIYPALNSETRTLRARVVLDNRRLKLKPGMFGEVTLALSEAGGLLIPREALVDTGENQYVFVAQDGGHFVPRSVKVGARAGESVEILDGLAEGEKVVETGNFLLDSESRLRAAISGHGHQH